MIAHFVLHFASVGRHMEAMPTTHPHLLWPNLVQRKAGFTDDSRHGRTNPEACYDFDFEIATNSTVIVLRISMTARSAMTSVAG